MVFLFPPEPRGGLGQYDGRVAKAGYPVNSDRRECALDTSDRINDIEAADTSTKTRWAMRLNIEPDGSMVAVQLIDRLDATSSKELEGKLDELIEYGYQTLILDFSQLEYISSAGLRTILTSAKKIRSKSGEIRIAGMSGMVTEIFQLSGFYDLFPIYDTVEAAKIA
jgi:anti-sigma B factor antagonist